MRPPRTDTIDMTGIINSIDRTNIIALINIIDTANIIGVLDTLYNRHEGAINII